MLLDIKNLWVEIEEKPILKGINLSVKAGEVHAIMGPNGSGKSTLSKVVAGHPSYKVTAGTIDFEINLKPKNLFELSPDERAREGIFLAFQYPVEIPGVTNLEFLMMSYNSVARQQGFPELNQEKFLVFVKEKMKLVKMKEEFLYRSVNSGFSGGEKKRNEILQMTVMNPRLAFLDETDSGLDIDALKIVSEGVNQFRSKENGIVMVTHYQRLLDYIKPDYVHVLSEGQIVKSGGSELALKLEAQGYDWLNQEG
jgi:Fe-S cluster assembly ATP-binding protein